MEECYAATHWDLYDNSRPDGADFYVGETELGHIHLDGSVHLAASHAIKTALLENNLAKKFPYGGELSGWVLFNIKDQHDADHALWLFQLNYDRLMGANGDELMPRITSKVSMERISK